LRTLNQKRCISAKLGAWLTRVFGRRNRTATTPAETGLLHVAAAFHGLQHGDFVGVFDVAAYGNPHGDSGDLHSSALQLLREVDRGSFPLHGGIRSHDDLVYITGIDTRNEIGNPELLGSDSVQRRDCTVEDVEDSIEVLGLFDGSDIRGLFHDAHQTLVAGRTGAVRAGIDVGDVVADRAETEIRFDVPDGLGQAFGIFIAGAEDVEGQTLRALGADAGELFQFINEPRHGFGKLGHSQSWFLCLVILSEAKNLCNLARRLGIS